MYEDKQWALGLKQSGILNLLGISHFGRPSLLSDCVKQLLSCIHGGALWLEKRIEIDAQLISKLTSLPL
jgi:hypothetical protein